MTVSQKAALSLLVSVLLFAVFSVLAFTGLFDFIETKFYNPSITSSLFKELGRDVSSIDSFLGTQQAKFTAALQEPSVKRSFLSNQTSEDIYERTRIFGLIQESLPGLQWVRFIDSGGIRLNYSTYPPDILNQDRTFVAYRNYPGLTGALPYDTIASYDGDNGRYILDEDGERILFSIPFYDLYEVFHGTALFSLSVRALSEHLISEGRIKAGEDISLISDPPGILIGKPASSGKSLYPQISSVWQAGFLYLTTIDSADTYNMYGTQDNSEMPTRLALISSRTGNGIFAGQLINENIFSFPLTMKIILLVSFFLTVYLTIFLLFNLRQDSITIVQNRLKQLQITLIEQYYERKGTMDWGRWSRELEQRREEIRGELKKGIKEKSGPKDGKNDIDLLIDKSWDELLNVIAGRRETSIDEEKLQSVLNRILAVPGPAPLTKKQETIPEDKTSVVQTAVDKTAETEPEAELVEELEAAEPAEAEPEAELVEELEAAEPVEAETEAELAQAELFEAEPEAEPEAVPVEELEAIEPAGEESIVELVEINESYDPELVEELEVVEEPGEIYDFKQSDDAGMFEQVEIISEVPPGSSEPVDTGDMTEPEEPEVLEELMEDDGSGSSPESGVSAEPEIDLEELARQIEFSEVSTAEDEDEPVISRDLEIASPFKTMFTKISETSWVESDTPPEEPVQELVQEPDPIPAEELVQEPEEEAPESVDEVYEEELEPLPVADDEDEKKNSRELNPDSVTGPNNFELEALPVQTGFSLVYKPFLAISGSNPQILQAQGDGQPENLLEEIPEDPQEDVIEEKDGVPFINRMNIGNKFSDLDEDFKKLVDSVI